MGSNTASSVIAVVHCVLRSGLDQEVLAEGQLADDGFPPDQLAGDRIYSGRFSVPGTSLVVGTYYCQIDARSSDGYSGNQYILPLSVYRQANRPPILSNASAPDTVSLGGRPFQEFAVTVKAWDPDGQSDIAKVFFNSYKPDGSAASGNPFQMYDDGGEVVLYPPDITSGDMVKGDSVYTLTVKVDTTNAKGQYRFEFMAADRSSAFSDTLVRFIQVVP